MSEFDEYLLYIQSLYDKYLGKTENRNISYGEIYWIQNLSKNELANLENELSEVLYSE